MDKTFWIYEPSLLFNNITNYLPEKDMNTIEKYNTTTLLCIIIMIVLVCIGYIKLALIPLIIIILIIILYLNITDNFDNIDSTDIVKENTEVDTLIMPVNEYDSEIGYYDSDDTLRFDRTTNKVHKPESTNLNYECRKPTVNNPFMNIQLHDFDNEQQVEACNVEDDKINRDIVHSFNDKLFMNIDDAFSRTNSQRQFFTTPNTRIPNNQTEFANWLYKVPETCKENNEQCLRYDDIRYNISKGY